MKRLLRALSWAGVAIVVTAALLPSSVSADHDCRVQDAAVPCDDAGVSSPHSPSCDVAHYHGALDGVTEDGDDCGHGRVISLGHAAFTDMAGALQYLGFNAPQVDQLSELAQSIEPQRYRYGTSFTEPATFDADWTRVISHGVAEVEFGPDSLAGTSDFPCNALEDGFRTFCVTGGPLTGVPYIGFFTTYGDDFPIGETGSLSVNLSWPTTVGDLPTLKVQGSFVADTWQGASYIPYVTFGPDPWSLRVTMLDDGGLIPKPNSEAWGLIGGNSSLFFVPTDELMQGEPTPDGLRTGFALQVHDGSFGACDDCVSVITPYPAFPREGLMLLPERELLVANGPEIPIPSATAPPDEPAVETTTNIEDDGGGVSTATMILVTVGGLGLLLIAAALVRANWATPTGPPEDG